jgi:hypothetical protein
VKFSADVQYFAGLKILQAYFVTKHIFFYAWFLWVGLFTLSFVPNCQPDISCEIITHVPFEKIILVIVCK